MVLCKAQQWLDVLQTARQCWFCHALRRYNNQYMIVDIKRFAPSQELQPGLLTVVEQMPGLVVSGDKTQVSTSDHEG
jgi:hypothetical protein